ncbi:MAG TPA: WD40 repeat domain-containing protein [Flavisolibacter sp.]|nr:WD40 repeat domain-containing protein [Flavisolibacter sp.]
MSPHYTFFLLACAWLALTACGPQKVDNRHSNATSPAPEAIWAAAWSPDGKHFALGGDDSTVWLYDANDYRLLQSFALKGMIRALSWNPDGKTLAVATMVGVELLDAEGRRLRPVRGLRTGGRGIGWSDDGRLLGLADNHGKAHLIDSKGKILRSMSKGNDNSYFALDWHPSGMIMTVAGDELIHFDTAGRLLQKISHRHHNTGILTIDWHPGGSFIAIGDYGQEENGLPTLLQLFEKNGKMLKEIGGSKTEYRAIRWSPSGDKLATASDALRIWSPEGRLLHLGESPADLWGLAWSPDGKRILTASFSGGAIRIWNDEARLIKEIK